MAYAVCMISGDQGYPGYRGLTGAKGEKGTFDHDHAASLDNFRQLSEL